MVDSLYEKFGGLSLPVAATDVTDTLAPLDPARDTLARLFEAAINAELGPAWGTVTASLPATHVLVKDGTNPVNDVLLLEPSPSVMQQRKTAFPLLCVHRTGSPRFEQRSVAGQVEALIQPWDVHYILGPLSADDLRRFGDACIAVAKILRLVIRKRGHPAYQSGALQFFPGSFDVGQVGTLGAVQMTGYDGPGQAQYVAGPEAPTYWSIIMHLETSEYTTEDPETFGNYEAADIAIAAGDADELLPNMVQMQTDVPYQNP